MDEWGKKEQKINKKHGLSTVMIIQSKLSYLKMFYFKIHQQTKLNDLSLIIWLDFGVYLQCITFIAFCNLQYKSSQYIESLAVTHSFIPAGVCQKHPLQHHPVLFPFLATIRAAACPV